MLAKLKKITYFRPRLKSRHPTHDPLRTQLPLLLFRSLLRLGSTTEVNDGKVRVELNSVQSIKNSSNKFLMKSSFAENDVKTSSWSCGSDIDIILDNMSNHTENGTTPYPLVAKHIHGSRNRGNTLIKSKEQLDLWVQGKDLNNYIFEKFYNYNREYRLHVTKDGCFYTCRKMLRSDTPEDKRWFRNDSNSNWIVETNEDFDKPVNWDKVVEESVKALVAVGLDVGAVDLRIQSSRNKDGNLRDDPDFIVVEINSAPSFGEGTLKQYLEVIPKLLKDKYAGTIN